MIAFWPCKVNVVRTNSMLFVQSSRCSYKVDVIRVKSVKCKHYSYKVVVVLCPKLTLFAKCGRCLHKVDVVCTKFRTKKDESWKVNFVV